MNAKRATPELLGEPPSIIATRALVARLARSRAGNVLIYGETGTGKGLIARMIHEQSGRAGAHAARTESDHARWKRIATERNIVIE